jgi:phage terminase large subunit-like protein
MECFAAGRDHRERLFLAGNRCGKTEGVGAYEMSLHLTGRYPDWWQGRRFDHAIKAWAAGDTNQTTRDILQAKLLGKVAYQADEVSGLGTGMIPGDTIIGTRPKAGIPGAIESAYVHHVTGGISVLQFKSYEAGRESFQGTEQDVVWLDEEPPADIYIESLMRTMQTGSFGGGIVLLTFTPLNGWSEVVDRFLNEQERRVSNRHVTQASWDDVPHLSESEKADMLAKLPAYQRDARTKGIPQLGSGAIYPVPESDIVVPHRDIPPNWPRVYGLDVGYNRTAAVWGARDPQSQIIYLYSEHYMGREEPAIHAAAIRARGAWIPGVIDPSARGRGQADGRQLLQDYQDLGLDLQMALNAVESGLFEVWQLLSGGMFESVRRADELAAGIQALPPRR